MVKRYTLSCPSPDGFAVEPFDADLLKATVIVRGTDYDALAARLADMTAEADSWRANARDSGEEARKYKARLAEVTEERDALRVTLDMVLHIPNMTNDQLEELKARCQKIIDGATDSADEVLHQCSCGHAWMAPQLPDKPCPVCNTETDNG